MAIGDHLVVSFGWYQHHGIDVGHGEVVHFGRGLHEIESAVVEKVSRDEFAKNRPIERMNSEVAFEPDEVRERALSRIGERGYNLESNNCEHFVHWCRSGQHMSNQSDIGETMIRQAVSALSKPVVAKSVVSTLAKAGSRLAGKAVAPLFVKSIGRAAPILIAADAIQAATEMVATKNGYTKDESRTIGKRTGASMSAAIGFAMAGGPGTVATLATWFVSQKMSERFLEKVNKKAHGNSAPESSKDD